MRARGKLQRDIELRGRTLGPVDLFGGRRRHREARSFAGRDIDVETIAAGDAARGVDEDRRQTVGLGRGKADAQRAGFMQMAAAGDALDLMHVESHRAPGTVGREDRQSRARGIGPHPPPNLSKKGRATLPVASQAPVIAPSGG